jgi:O-antigen ligase
MSTILHPKEDYNWSAQEGRKEVWKRGVGYMMSHPLLGLGVGTYPVAEGKLSEIGRELAARGKGFKWSVAHNSFLETGAELGIPGLCVFLGIFIVSIRALARLSSRSRHVPWITPRETALAQLLIGSLIGFMAAGFFVSAEYFAYLYFLLGLTIGLLKLVRLRREAIMAAVSNQMR